MADFSISTLSVCSHVKFASFLPKCPNPAVGLYFTLSRSRVVIIPKGVRSKTSFIILDNFSSETVPVPNVLTRVDVGSATPIA